MTARQLRDTLARLGLSQSGAARLLGVTQPSLSDWCRGRYAIPGPVVAALTAWLRHGLPE